MSGIKSRLDALEKRGVMDRLQAAKNKQAEDEIEKYKSVFVSEVKKDGLMDNIGKLIYRAIIAVETLSPIVSNIAGVLVKGPLKLDLAIDLIFSVLGSLPAAVEVVSSMIEVLVDQIFNKKDNRIEYSEPIKKQKGRCQCLGGTAED